MFKKFSLAVVALALIATCSFASDDVLNDVADLKGSSINDASISVETDGLDGLDVDALASSAGGKSDEAIEACFRSFGYNRCGYNYGCRSYYSCYRPCYTPCYYRPVHYTYCYRPVYYTTYTTCYSYPTYSCYWGCY